MKLVITKLHKTHKRWFADLNAHHPLFTSGLNIPKLRQIFSDRVLPVGASCITKGDSRFAVANARQVVYIPVDEAIKLSDETLEALAPNFKAHLQSFVNQGVEGLILGFKEE